MKTDNAPLGDILAIPDPATIRRLDFVHSVLGWTARAPLDLMLLAALANHKSRPA